MSFSKDRKIPGNASHEAAPSSSFAPSAALEPPSPVWVTQAAASPRPAARVPEAGAETNGGSMFEAAPLPLIRPDEQLGLVRTYLRNRRVKHRGIEFLRSLPQLPVQLTRTANASSRSEIGAAWREWGLQNPGGLLALARRLRRFAPGSRSLAQAEALATARCIGWDAATPLFLRLSEGNEGPRPEPGPASALLALPRDLPAEFVLPRTDRPAQLDQAAAKQIVVYTCWMGSRPRLAPVQGRPEALRMICFTDHPAEIPGWEVLPADPVHTADSYRMRPHRALAEIVPAADWSLYLAPDRLVMGNLHTLFCRWLMPLPLALWRHPESGDWHDLAERHILFNTEPAEAVLAQARACARECIARDTAVWDLRQLWRKHTTPEVAAAMDAWWTLEQEAPGAPELSLCRALARVGGSVRPSTLPASLGHAEANIFSGYYVRPADPPPAAPHLRRRRVPITFLYSARWPQAGCTIMRGEQLSRMIANRFPDRYDVTYTPETELVRDQIVIVNRMAIEETQPEELAALKKRGNLLVSDWQDLPIAPAKNMDFDAHLALSPLQQVEMSGMFPRTPVFHVTHHVNPDVPHVVPPEDRLRTVYFGFSRNTVVAGSLRAKVHFAHAVNADFTVEHWRAIAPRYNCHWIVRQLGRTEWRKPFLKGFVAARCGAPVIVTRDDQNAAYYLGDEYPFYARSVEKAELERVWVQAASSFGGTEWKLAREIMRQVEARSTDEVVCTDFSHMVEQLIA